MADTSVKLSGTYDSIEAYNILEEMRTLGTDVEGYKNDAQAAASTATGAVSTAQGYANDASGYASNASTYASNASDSADEAAGYAANAYTSETNASTHATNASNSAGAAYTSEQNAAGYAADAAASEAVVAGALPLSGGTLTGNLTIDADHARTIFTDSNIGSFTVGLVGASGDYGAAMMSKSGSFSDSALMVRSSEQSTDPRFQLRAGDGTNTKDLVGKPDGALTWDGNDITPQTLTTINPNDVSVPNNTVKTITSFSLTKGTWLVHGEVSFPSNSSGYRRIGIGNSNSSIGFGRFWYIAAAPVNGSETRMSLTTFITVSSTTTYYLNAHQTSGSALTCGGGVQLFRLSPIL